MGHVEKIVLMSRV